MIHFMKFKFVYLACSAFLIGCGVFSLVVWGLNLSIDFTGGALLEVSKAKEVTIQTQDLSNEIAKIDGVAVGSIQTGNDGQNFIIRMNPINEAKKNEVLSSAKVKYPSLTEQRFETVGPVLGKELLIKTLTAIFLAACAILLYVAYQFKNRLFGISAVLAMFHDTLILLGVFSLLGHFFHVEVDMLFVTAVLTTLSFSVHDTIVVFDRIREWLKENPHMDMHVAVDSAITQTLPRSLNNSLTIIIMLTALFVLGGEPIRWFVCALLVGTISGTYSSPFIATPLLLVGMKFTQRKQKRK